MKFKELLLSYAKRLRKSNSFDSSEEKELFYLKLGATIRKIRKACGFTQDEFARVIKSHQNILSAVERGKYKGDVFSVIMAVGKVFYSKDFIVGGEDEGAIESFLSGFGKQLPISAKDG